MASARIDRSTSSTSVVQKALTAKEPQIIISKFKSLDYPLAYFKRPLLLISVGVPAHEHDYLSSTVNLLNVSRRVLPEAYKPKHIDVLVAGTLQRHNYWLFCDKFTDEELDKFFETIPDETDFRVLALLLASFMLNYAREAESKYIINNGPTFLSLRQENDMTFKLIRWEEMVPVNQMPSGKLEYDKNDKKFGGYADFLEKVTEKYNHGIAGDQADALEFTKAIDKTAAIFVDAPNKREMIKQQSLRLAAAANRVNKHGLAMILRDDSGKTFAKICGRNYLLEESPLLFPVLSKMGYMSLMYPGPITDALSAVKQAFNSSIEWYHICHNHDDPKNDPAKLNTMAVTLQASNVVPPHPGVVKKLKAHKAACVSSSSSKPATPTTNETIQITRPSIGKP